MDPCDVGYCNEINERWVGNEKLKRTLDSFPQYFIVYRTNDTKINEHTHFGFSSPIRGPRVISALCPRKTIQHSNSSGPLTIE